jgi:hypothetical protein
MARGARLKLVADRGHLAVHDCSQNALLVRRELFEAGVLNHPDQIRDLRIELNPLLPEAYYVDLALREFELGIDDLEVFTLPPAAGNDAFTNEAVDLSVAAEPFLSLLLQTGEAVIWRSGEEMVPDMQWATMLFGRSLLDDHPELGERFMVAYLKGVHAYNEGKTSRNLGILSRHTGLDEHLLRAACWPPIRNDGRVDSESFRDYQEWAVSRGITERVLTESELVDHRFAEHASALLAR